MSCSYKNINTNFYFSSIKPDIFSVVKTWMLANFTTGVMKCSYLVKTICVVYLIQPTHELPSIKCNYL